MHQIFTHEFLYDNLSYKNSCVNFDAFQGEMVYFFLKNEPPRSKSVKLDIYDHIKLQKQEYSLYDQSK